MNCLVLWLVFFVVLNSDSMEINGEQGAWKIFNYYVSELVWQEHYQPHEHLYVPDCLSRCEDYFAHTYNQTVMGIAHSNCLTAEPEYYPTDNNKTNSLQPAERVVWTPLPDIKIVTTPIVQPAVDQSGLTIKQTNYKYNPSHNTVQNPEQLARYDAFHRLLTERYDQAIKKCCKEQFETLAELRTHIKMYHAFKNKTDHGRKIQFMFKKNKGAVAYTSVDAAVSYLLLRKNKKIFSCDRCKGNYKSHTSFYLHYKKKCTQ